LWRERRRRTSYPLPQGETLKIPGRQWEGMGWGRERGRAEMKTWKQAEWQSPPWLKRVWDP